MIDISLCTATAYKLNERPRVLCVLQYVSNGACPFWSYLIICWKFPIPSQMLIGFSLLSQEYWKLIA